MEEEIFNALETRSVYLPGGFDRNGKITFIVNIGNDFQLWNREYLESITYLKKSLSLALLKNGVSVIVDAQKCSSRITRTHSCAVYSLFGETPVDLYLVRSEGFWEKHVEPCTKSHTKDEPVVLSKARLSKYFETHNLPLELGGTLQFNYDLWLQQRKSIDEFKQSYGLTLDSLENLHVLFSSSQSLRPAESTRELKQCTHLYALVQRQIESVLEIGNSILLRLADAYPPATRTHAGTATEGTTAFTSCTIMTGGSSVRPDQTRETLPPDLCCERQRIELHLNEIERRQTLIRFAWTNLVQSIREGRELANLEEGVAFVTTWILTTAEPLLSRQQAIGSDVGDCEELRISHDAFEVDCSETYGFYAELLYRIDTFAGSKSSIIYKDLLSQRDFMEYVCRSFATRLERRRKVLITSLRFYRLLNEYFEATSTVFESLVMGNKMENFEAAAGNLQRLKDSQASLEKLESELTREGEKLSDMLAMPVKDALGRDLHFDYSDDIASIHDILETTAARRTIFTESVELQKLTLEQVTHIYTYEEDARMSKQWMEDLYDAMIRCHTHVGSNIYEIQVQKDDLQSFQQTGKSIHHYGSQMLEASQALRVTCKLGPETPQLLLLELERTWNSIQAIGQEHMIRLRVSAVFHRNVDVYRNQLQELKFTVMTITHSGNSSSGVSSEDDAQSSPEITAVDVDGDGDGGLVEMTETEMASRGSEPEERPFGQKGRRHHLRKSLQLREELLLEVGRMVRLGRLLKTRLKEPFILDLATGKSVLSDELNDDVMSPSSDSGNGDSELNTITTSSAASTASAATTMIITPTGQNLIARDAITTKLTEISEMAESLDAVLRDLQEEVAFEESQSTQAMSRNKLQNIPNIDIEDWQSRSTEDDSFVTASEGGNFTPHSTSSSFQTASERASWFIGSEKNSFDASEADDLTFDAFEMPDLTTPRMTSNNISAHIEMESLLRMEDYENSIVSIEEMRSHSMTPTLGDQPCESDHEMASCIADAPSMEILTEASAMPTSVTPEVSSTDNASGDRTNINKPNAAWRRNKYYEKVTQRTIRGFL